MIEDDEIIKVSLVTIRSKNEEYLDSLRKQSDSFLHDESL